MNKKISLASLLLIFAVLFSNCSKKEDFEGGGNKPEEKPEKPSEQVDGYYSWEKDRKELLESTDMVLIYAGGKHRDPYKWDTDRMAPYVTYVDEQGKEHWFFDSFLFIEFRSDVIQFCSGYSLDSATQSDWQKLVDYYFESYTGIGALNRCIAEASKRIGKPSKKRQIVITLPEPIVRARYHDNSSSSKYWGSLKDGKILDFSKDKERIEACKWYIDYVRKKFNEKKYEHVELAGFYWVAETAAQSSTILYPISEYVNKYKYSLNWIPYYGAQGYNIWKSFGFDFTYYQPNYFFYPGNPYSQLEHACSEAKKFDLDLEIEFDGNALAVNGQGKRLEDYMKAFKDFGFWEKRRFAYYEGGGALLLLKNSKDPKDQELYHKFCKFVVERPLRKIK